MELTPGQRRLAFVIIVIVLVGLGIYLIHSRESSGTPAAAPTTSATKAAPSASTSSASSPPSAAPTPTSSSAASGAEIYQWLPFKPADLNAAVQVTTSFAADYVTWSYKEDEAAYVAKMNGLITAQVQTFVEEGYETSGVASLRTTQKQVSTGSGAIDSISSLATTPTTSITFLVTINQQVTSTQPTATTDQQYWVTVAPSGGTWQVSNIQLANLGNS
jgi:hypothetical protein